MHRKDENIYIVYYTIYIYILYTRINNENINHLIWRCTLCTIDEKLLDTKKMVHNVAVTAVSMASTHNDIVIRISDNIGRW